MNRTTTVLVALIAAAGLSTMAYAVPEQRALAWGSFAGFGGCGFGFGGCGGFFANGCGFGCGFFGDGFHRHIIQTINQINTCHGNGDDEKTYSNDEGQREKQTVCVNTAVNHVGPGFVGLPSIPSLNPPGNDDHKQPGNGAVGGNGGSGGAGGSGGEGGQAGKNVANIASPIKGNISQKANGGNSNGGHAGNANGGNART
jgi:hypothetical protein